MPICHGGFGGLAWVRAWRHGGLPRAEFGFMLLVQRESGCGSHFQTDSHSNLQAEKYPCGFSASQILRTSSPLGDNQCCREEEAGVVKPSRGLGWPGACPAPLSTWYPWGEANQQWTLGTGQKQEFSETRLESPV